ncbi:MAG: single-stranded DNA-binding protein [bacterium]|nr:single-stranded DNA-binding protein [bacterium]
MNSVNLMGRLVRDPEPYMTENGIYRVKFRIAVNRTFAKEGQQNADFINCVAWRKTGEIIAKYFKKGDMIAIIGELHSNSWTDDEGASHFSTDVLIKRLFFTGSKSETENPEETEFSGWDTEDFTEDDLPF